MDQYIKQLLLLHSKIILPDFGAIVIANEETGELMFNEYLTYDDGKLSKLLESESTMDIQDAKNNVAKYIRELNNLLNKGETYSIFQLGEFRKADDGSIIFEGNIKTGGAAASDLSFGPSPTPPKKTEPAVPNSNLEKEENEVKRTDEEEQKKIIVPPVPKTDEKSDSEVKESPQSKKEEPKEAVKKTQEELKSEIKKTEEEQKKIIVPPVPKPAEKSDAEVKETPQAKKEQVKEADKKPITTSNGGTNNAKTDSTQKKNIYVEKEKVVDGAPIVEPIDKDEVPPIVIVEEKKRRRGFLFWFLLLLFLLILIGSICISTNYKSVQQYFGWGNTELVEKQDAEEAAKKAELEKEKLRAEAEKKRNDALNKEISDTTKVDSESDSLNNNLAESETATLEGTDSNSNTESEVADLNEETTEVVQESVPITASTGNHHVVIGCFSQKSNADGLVNKYKQKGYDSKIISQMGGLYFVAAQSYSSFSEAKSELSNIRQDIEGAWLLKQ